MFLMNVTKQSVIRILVILAMMPLMVLSMNCGRTSAVSAASMNVALKPSGAISFVNIDKESRCGPGERVRARILIHPEKGPELVTEDCRAISPRALTVSEIGLYPHNLAHAVYGDRLFERYDADPQSGAAPEHSTGLLCRGSDEEKVVDVAVAQDRLIQKVAEYDDQGRFVKVLETVESQVRATASGYVGANVALKIDSKGKAQYQGLGLTLHLNCVQH